MFREPKIQVHPMKNTTRKEAVDLDGRALLPRVLLESKTNMGDIFKEDYARFASLRMTCRTPVLIRTTDLGSIAFHTVMAFHA